MNLYDFQHKKPEDTGIKSQWIINFLDRLEKCRLPIHSFILMKDDSIIAETYYAPYKSDTLHRMFSITKSFVSIGIGLLEQEGKLSLSDKVVKFFPEKLATDNPPAYLADMTIEDMLKMSSCHSSTTYKAEGCKDWTGSFFTTKPSHISGTTFSYDTSATQTMYALVEKLSGMTMLDYLRSKFLDEIGFSKNAYVLDNGLGEGMGGSGLMATPMDILKFMYALNNHPNLPKEYINKACSNMIDTYAKTSSWEEMQGYGYQFWQTTHNGVACYGMGGQYAIYYPNENIYLVTTADTQGRNGGTQLIYDAFYQEILDKYNEVSAPDVDLEKYLSTRMLFSVEGSNNSTLLPEINDTRYNLDENIMGFKWISLTVDKKNFTGTFDYENSTGVFSLPFGIGCNHICQFPGYGYKTAVSGAFRDNNTFLIKAHLIDECIGNIFIQLVFKDDGVTLMMRKFEETMFNEFDGFVSGHR